MYGGGGNGKISEDGGMTSPLGDDAGKFDENGCLSTPDVDVGSALKGVDLDGCPRWPLAIRCLF